MKFSELYNMMLDEGADNDTVLIIGQVTSLDPVVRWEIAYEHESNSVVMIPIHDVSDGNVIQLH